MGKLAVKGGEKAVKTDLTKWPLFDKREEEAVLDALRSGGWGGYPPPARLALKFVEKFGKFCDTRYVATMASGTSALMVALRALGVGYGDEVIAPALTFVASASCALFIGATPVFVDVKPESLCIETDGPNGIEAAITEKTKAIVIVHLGSRCADMDRVMEIARKHNLKVVEDCAHAHGTKWRDKSVGAWGDAGAFSFQASKVMTAGEGGAITTDSEDVYIKARALINSGRLGPQDPDSFDVCGYSLRMTEFQAAILDVQVDKLQESWIETKSRNMERFAKRLSDLPGIQLLEMDKRITRSSGYAFIFKFDESVHEGVSRDKFGLALMLDGLPCSGKFYEPIYRSPLFPLAEDGSPLMHREQRGKVDYRKYNFPVAHKAAYHETIWLMHNLFLGPESHVDQMADAVEKTIENIGELRS